VRRRRTERIGILNRRSPRRGGARRGPLELARQDRRRRAEFAVRATKRAIQRGLDSPDSADARPAWGRLAPGRVRWNTRDEREGRDRADSTSPARRFHTNRGDRRQRGNNYRSWAGRDSLRGWCDHDQARLGVLPVAVGGDSRAHPRGVERGRVHHSFRGSARDKQKGCWGT